MKKIKNKKKNINILKIKKKCICFLKTQNIMRIFSVFK